MGEASSDKGFDGGARFMTQPSLLTSANTVAVELRDYQNECLLSLTEYARGGGKRALVTLPTGTGKTVVFAQIPRAAKKKVMVIAHREELLTQALEKMRVANPFMSFTLEQAGSHADPTAQVVVASIQTLAVGKGRLDKFNPLDFSCLVVDEAHHIAANSYQRFLEYFGLAPNPDWKPDPEMDLADRRKAYRRMYAEFKVAEWAPLLVGFTATPGRTDKIGLENTFDDIVFSRTIREMMEAGWLCKVRGQQVWTGVDITGVRTAHGEYVESELSEAVNTPERNALTVHAYKDYALGWQALVFCVDRQHARDMAAEFDAAGIVTACVLGDTPKDERRALIAAYSRGEIQVMVGCMVFTEGFDDPGTSCVIMARPTKSSLVYTQCIGRGTRLFPGKESLLVLDLADVAKTGVQTVNSLFGLPPRLKLNDTDVLEAQRIVESFEGQIPMVDMGEVEDFSDLTRMAREFDPLRMLKLPKEIEDATHNSWVPTSWGYALSIMGRGQLGVVEDLLGHATVRLKPPGERIRSLGEQYADVREAIIAADAWLEAEAGDVAHLMDRDAPWKRQPASSKQKAALTRLKIKYLPNLTKGNASQLIGEAQAKEPEQRGHSR